MKPNIQMQILLALEAIGRAEEHTAAATEQAAKEFKANGGRGAWFKEDETAITLFTAGARLSELKTKINNLLK